MSQVTIAAISGLLYFMGTSRIGYGISTFLGSPVTLGFIFGLLYGNPTQGLIIGASIQLIYLGVVYTGGNVPSDAALAACIAIPAALASGLSSEAAVALAVPFGILGAFVDQVRRTSNLVWLHKADKYALDGNEKGIFKSAIIYPTIIAFFIRFIPVFAVNLVGPTAAEALVNYLPIWVTNGLSVAGGVLPAIGFSIIIMQIGRKEILPFFFMGYFAVKYLNIGTMACAVFGLCIALVMYFNSSKKEVQ
ncbi:PTS mannose/fructose/sorbose/N-acetylgalactosamine transporter subunit IIC [Clostridium polynesiense]|uniref:PTS mannose/fructose/sorbose/N-acetylgalactosamine transporter subunit IIC n=1 Tax=Clostridium polynesiense TaxID=1325933 RepID=UPI00058AEEDC|nr:PTS sugar transporter subunit IIC [Clostridium polynesiense]